MVTRAPHHVHRFSRIPFAVVVLVSTAATLGVLGSTSYRMGHGVDTESRFFVASFIATIDDATAVCPVEYALHARDANDVVFVGDSTCRTGLDPAVFERLTGLTAYNLGSLRGVGPAGFVITAKAYLLNHPMPRVMVLCVSPGCFEGELRTVGGRLPSVFAANYGPEVAEVVPVVDRVGYFCKQGVHSAWERAGLREGMASGTDARDIPLLGLDSETYWTLKRKTSERRGFFKLPGTHGPPKGLGPATGPLIQEEWKTGIDRLVQVCEEQGVPLVVRFAPISADVAKARDFSPLETWSRELETVHRKLTVGRPNLLIYDSALMWDAFHVNAAGIAKFAPLIAKDVQSALGE
jgi:hypothetical protein